MLSAPACGAPITTTMVLIFTAMSAVQFWKSAPTLAEEAKAFVDVVSEYSSSVPPPMFTRIAKDFFMMDYCATLQAQGRSYKEMGHLAFQEEVDRLWKVQEETGDIKKWCDMAAAARKAWAGPTRGPVHAHVKTWSKQLRRGHHRARSMRSSLLELWPAVMRTAGLEQPRLEGISDSLKPTNVSRSAAADSLPTTCAEAWLPISSFRGWSLFALSPWRTFWSRQR